LRPVERNYTGAIDLLEGDAKRFGQCAMPLIESRLDTASSEAWLEKALP
jgi:hypothetical protein